MVPFESEASSVVMARTGLEIECGGVARSDRGALSGYLANPVSGGRGILVIHDEWGLTDHVRDVCDRLARAGFVALAPDLLAGRTAADVAEAGSLARGFGVERAADDLDAAAVELFNQNATEGPRLGALGFGVGGQLALLAASRNRRVGAVADFYGTDPAVAPDLKTLQAPVLAIFAGADEAAAPVAERLDAELRRAGVRAVIETRAGLRPGYMNDSRPEVHAAVEAAQDWDNLLAFFRAELS
jgi:carboxymethylenebutenolidase